MSQSLRQQIADYLVTAIKEIEEPRVSFVTLEPFNVLEIAITQFPAVLVTMREETRETVTLGAPSVGRRTGNIRFEVRAYVRGNDLDTKRNELLEALEEQLEKDRYFGLRTSGIMDSQITNIEVIDRMPPLAEILIRLEVRYNYTRGNN
jgi:hypothetical protein